MYSWKDYLCVGVGGGGALDLSYGTAMWLEFLWPHLYIYSAIIKIYTYSYICLQKRHHIHILHLSYKGFTTIHIFHNSTNISSTMQNVIGPIHISHLYRTFLFFIFSWPWRCQPVIKIPRRRFKGLHWHQSNDIALRILFLSFCLFLKYLETSQKTKSETCQFIKLGLASGVLHLWEVTQ